MLTLVQILCRLYSILPGMWSSQALLKSTQYILQVLVTALSHMRGCPWLVKGGSTDGHCWWEQMKKVLSANAQASLSVESLMDDIDVRGSMSRDHFEELARPVLERVRLPLQQVPRRTTMLTGCIAACRCPWDMHSSHG